MANPNVEAAYFWVQVGQNATNEKFRVKGSDFKNVAKGPEMVWVQRGNDHYWTWYGQPKDLNNPDFSYRFRYYVKPGSETANGKSAQPDGDGEINFSLYFESPGPYPVNEWRNVRNTSKTINDLDGKQLKTLNNPDLKDGDVCRITHEGGDLEAWYVVDVKASSSGDNWLKFKALYTKGGDDPTESGYNRERVDVKSKGSKPAADGTQVLKLDFYSKENAQPFTQIADTDWVWAQAKDENNNWKHYKVSGKNFKELFVTFQPNFEVTSGTVRLNMKFANTSQTVGVVRAENGHVYNCSGNYTNLSLPVGNYVVPTLEAGGLQCIKLYGTHGNGNFDFKSNFDMSTVKNMSDFVNNCRLFNGNISHFDLSNVTNAKNAFQYCHNFNADIGGGFNMASATDVRGMFIGCKVFNQPINQFKFLAANNLHQLFRDCTALNQSITGIEYKDDAYLSYAFYNCQAMNHPIDAEQVPFPPNVRLWHTLGYWTGFKQSIANWTQPLPYSIGSLFYRWNQFNQNVAHLNFTNCTRFSGVFLGSAFNNDSVKDWDFTNTRVQDISYMFEASSFDQDCINNWDLSNINNVSYLFTNSKFGSGSKGVVNLGSWNMSNVESMSYMFKGSNITNCGMANWDTSNVTNMTGTFSNSVVLEDLSGWDVSKVQCMREIFSDYGARLTQVSEWGFQKMNPNINKWNPVSVSNFKAAFENVWLYTSEDEYTNVGPFHLHEWRMPAIPANEASTYAGTFNVSGPISNWNNTSNLAKQRISRPSFALPPISPSYKPDYTIYTSHGRDGFFDYSYHDPSYVQFKKGTWKTIRTSYGDDFDGATQTSDLSFSYYSANRSATVDIFANDDGGSFQFGKSSSYSHDLSRITFASPFGEYPELVNAPTNMYRLLEGSSYVNISNITGFENINTSNVTNMGRLFNALSNSRKFNIGQVDIAGWDVSNVTDMDGMFSSANRDCISAGDLSGWCITGVSAKPSSWPGKLTGVIEKDPYWGQCPGPDFVPEEPGGMPDGDWNNYKWSVLIETNFEQFLQFFERKNVWKRQKGDASFSSVGDGYSVYMSPTEEYIIASTSTSLDEWMAERDINFLAADTSNITNMAYAFDNFEYDFNGTGLEFFDTSNVTNLYKAFNNKSYFNQDLSNWDLRKVACSYRWDYGTGSWASQNKPRPGYGPS